MQFFLNGEEFNVNPMDNTQDNYLEYLAIIATGEGQPLEIEDGIFLNYNPDDTFWVGTRSFDPLTNEHPTATEALDEYRALSLK